MPFSWSVAIRLLREGRMQSLLIIIGASVGVAVIVFLSSLIDAVGSNLIDKTLGTQAHVILSAPDDTTRPLQAGDDKTAVFSRIQQPAQRLKSISSWPKVLDAVKSVPLVVATAPMVSGAGFAYRGAANKSITIQGVAPKSYNAIVAMNERIIDGTFELQGTEAVIGKELARELGVRVGDKVRLSAAQKDPQPFKVKGIFDTKNKDANLRWVFISIPTAQSLLDLSGGISSIQVKVTDIFEADDVATAVARRTGLKAESWMGQNSSLLVALQSQKSSSGMIQFFVVLAVALGIASVLFVSVVQKSKEIGILKAMGTQTNKVLRIFMIQGLLVGLAGSVVGCLIGAALMLFFKSTPGGAPLPIELEPFLFLRASLVATLSGVIAAVAPARRASRLDPAEVIRNG